MPPIDPGSDDEPNDIPPMGPDGDDEPIDAPAPEILVGARSSGGQT